MHNYALFGKKFGRKWYGKKYLKEDCEIIDGFSDPHNPWQWLYNHLKIQEEYDEFYVEEIEMYYNRYNEWVRYDEMNEGDQ